MKPLTPVSEPLKLKSCLNCNIQLDPIDHFCSNCGQKTDVARVKFGTFIRETLAGILNYESKFWRTISLMVRKPGVFPKRYTEGKHASYVNPFRLYLNFVILFFIVFGVYSSLNPIELDKENPFNGGNPLQTDLEQNDFFENLPQPVPALFKQIKSGITSPQTALENINLENTSWNRFLFGKIKNTAFTIQNFDTQIDNYRAKYISQLSIGIFLLIPILSLFFKLVYFRKKMYFTEHLVLVFNLQTVFTLFGLIAVLGLMTSETSNSILLKTLSIVFLVYLFVALRNFYKQGYLKTLFKFILINLVSLCLFSTLAIFLIFTAITL